MNNRSNRELVVRAATKRTRPFTTTQLANVTGVSRRHVRRVLAELRVKAGLVTQRAGREILHTWS